MNVNISVQIPSANVKARLYGKDRDFYCKSLDGRLQVLGVTPGATLDMFLERLSTSRAQRKPQKKR